MGKTIIAMAQINPIVGDFEGTSKKIIAYIERAKSAGADIVTFPELALCGYPPEDLLLKKSFLANNLLYIQRIQEYCSGISALVGFADSQNGLTYNAAALLSDQRLIAAYHKSQLPNYGVFDEKRYFEPGTRPLIFEIDGIRFAVSICEDIWVKESPTALSALDNKAQIDLNISASPFYAGKMKVRQAIVSYFAQRNKCTVFFNNLVGGQDELVFDGGGIVVNPSGKIIASARRFEEDLLITEMELSTPAEPLGTREASIPIPAKNPTRAYKSPPLRIEHELSDLEEIYKALVLGLKDYTAKNEFKLVVLGLSGGIDSALTAAIAVDALGADHVVGVTMPSQYTSKETFSDAELVARNLNIKLLTIPIKAVYESYLVSLTDVFGDGSPGIAGENLQARIRGNILMALSNRFGWLVLTTGNKSETAVGYSTLYGDMAGGFGVIKDVPKTLVYKLSEYLNGIRERELIPITTIKRAPTAELRPDQKDEDSLPPYSVLDEILKQYVEEDKAPDEIVEFDQKIVREVIGMVDRNEYKRRQAPPGIKITPKAFGKDRRLPITNKYLNSVLKGST